jgi:hypothetical protein
MTISLQVLGPCWVVRGSRGSVVDGGTVVGSVAGKTLAGSLLVADFSWSEVDGGRGFLCGLDIVHLGRGGRNGRLASRDTRHLAREGGSGGDCEQPRSCCPVHGGWLCEVDSMPKVPAAVMLLLLLP